MEWREDLETVVEVVCPGCGRALPPTHFWPRPIRGHSHTVRYDGRWGVCRHCAATEPSSGPGQANPIWAEPPRPRTTLRERLARHQQEDRHDDPE